MKTDEITILYESPEILAINKPSGLVVHPDGKTDEVTLCDWLLEKYPKIKGVGEPLVIKRVKEKGNLVIDRPGIVHRLDRDTSGVMVIAKTQAAHEHLKNQFKDRETQKIYCAFVYGAITEEQGVINRPIARSRNDFRLWSAQRGARGEAREAVTHYKVIARVASLPEFDLGASFIEASPKTGRTHQIRVHLKAINHPVIADPLYAPKRKALLGFERLALHARSLTFADMEGNEQTVVAPYPDDFKRAMKILKEKGGM